MAQVDFGLVFQWAVALEGHQWLTAQVLGEHSPDTFLSSGVPAGNTIRLRRYFPFEQHSGLFREFAATPLDPDAIRSFADKYGLLGGAASEMIPVQERSDGKGSLVGAGEKRRRWRQEIVGLRRCVELYDWARDGDVESLERHIIWDEDGVFYQSDSDWTPENGTPAGKPGAFSVIASSLYKDPTLDRLERGDLVRPALFFIQKEVNKRLAEETHLRILWTAGGSKLENRAVPKSLLGALWLQFALAIERGSTFRQCQECGKWFEVFPKTARSDKLFCSSACRVKAFRKRKAVEAGPRPDRAEVDETSARLSTPTQPGKGPGIRKRRKTASKGG